MLASYASDTFAITILKPQNAAVLVPSPRFARARRLQRLVCLSWSRSSASFELGELQDVKGLQRMLRFIDR